MNFIKTKACVLCGSTPVDPHHIYGSYGPHKTSDLLTAPLCRTCHEGIDTNPRRDWLIIEWVKLVHEYLRAQFE